MLHLFFILYAYTLIFYAEGLPLHKSKPPNQ